jgi:hypothetical protein
MSGSGMIDSLQCQREEPTQYQPPPHGETWRISRSNDASTDKAILGCLVDHANPKTGRVDPDQSRLAQFAGLL